MFTLRHQVSINLHLRAGVQTQQICKFLGISQELMEICLRNYGIQKVQPNLFRHIKPAAFASQTKAGDAHNTAHGEDEHARWAHISWHADAGRTSAATAHRVGQQGADDAPSAQEHRRHRVLPCRIQNPTCRAAVPGNQLSTPQSWSPESAERASR